MKRVDGVDITRGLLALSVAIYHYIQFLDISLLKRVNPIINAGLTSVDGFFMISGFALYYSYQKVDFSKTENINRYFIKRFARIAPLFYLCMLLNTISAPLALATIALVFLVGSVGKKFQSDNWIIAPFLIIISILLISLIKPLANGYDRVLIFNNLSFLFGFINPNLTSVRGGWSIGIEFVFYFSLPFILSLSKNQIKIIMIIAIVSSILAFNYQFFNNTNLFSYDSQEHSKELVTNWPLYTNPLNHFYFFMAGMLLFILYDRYYMMISNKQSLLYNLLIVLLCIYCVSSYLFGNPSYGKGRLIYSLITIAMISVTPFLIMPNGWFKKQLITLGDISYSVYLMQFPVFNIVLYFSKNMAIPVLGQLILTLLCLIIVAHVTYNFYEIPTKIYLARARLLQLKFQKPVINVN